MIAKKFQNLFVQNLEFLINSNSINMSDYFIKHFQKKVIFQIDNENFNAEVW